MFGGQTNGICAAAWPGWLQFNTGLHTGRVPLRLERRTSSPPVDDAWDDIVEVSFTPVSARTELVDFHHSLVHPIALSQGPYRVRYCAGNMDEAADHDSRVDGEPAIDRYLVQFWPAEPAPDLVVKQTSRTARLCRDSIAQISRPSPDNRPPATPHAPARGAAATPVERGNAPLRPTPGTGRRGTRPAGRAEPVPGSHEGEDDR